MKRPNLQKRVSKFTSNRYIESAPVCTNFLTSFNRAPGKADKMERFKYI